MSLIIEANANECPARVLRRPPYGVACSVLETFDKLCCAFNCHVLDALQNSVYIVVNTAATSGSTTELVHACFQLSFDAALTLTVTAGSVHHSFVRSPRVLYFLLST